MSEIAVQAINFAAPDYAGEVLQRFNTTLTEDLLKDIDFHHVNGIALAVTNPHPYDRLADTPNLADCLDGRSDVLPLVRGLPWGNGFHVRNGNQPVQSQLLADLTNRPIITFAAPTVGSRFGLNQAERQQSAGGDFDPVGYKVWSALDTLTQQRLRRFDTVGASLGASLTLDLASLVMRQSLAESIDSTTAIGLPQVKERSRSELLRDFGEAGAPELQERLMDAGVPQLLGSMGLSTYERQKAPLSFLAKTMAESIRHPLEGAALASGMGKTAVMWQRDVPTLLAHGIDVTLVSEGVGAIMPTDDARERVTELQERFGDSMSQWAGNLSLLSLPDGDHTSGDHFPTVSAIVNGDYPSPTANG